MLNLCQLNKEQLIELLDTVNVELNKRYDVEWSKINRNRISTDRSYIYKTTDSEKDYILDKLKKEQTL